MQQDGDDEQDWEPERQAEREPSSKPDSLSPVGELPARVTLSADDELTVRDTILDFERDANCFSRDDYYSDICINWLMLIFRLTWPNKLHTILCYEKSLYLLKNQDLTGPRDINATSISEAVSKT